MLVDIKVQLITRPQCTDSYPFHHRRPTLPHYTCDDFLGDQRVGIVHSRNDITFAGLDGRSFVMRSIATQPLTISDDILNEHV